MILLCFLPLVLPFTIGAGVLLMSGVVGMGGGGGVLVVVSGGGAALFFFLMRVGGWLSVCDAVPRGLFVVFLTFFLFFPMNLLWGLEPMAGNQMRFLQAVRLFLCLLLFCFVFAAAIALDFFLVV